MKNKLLKYLLVISAVLVLFIVYNCKQNGSDSGTANRERHEIEDKYKWNPYDIYASNEEWEKDKATFPERIAKISDFNGKLGESASSLFQAAEYISGVAKDLGKLNLYATLLSDQDTRESVPMRMLQETYKLWSDFGAITSFMQPEILAIPEATLKRFFKEIPDLEKYSMSIDNVYRLKPHTLDAKSENIIAEAGKMRGIANETHNVLSNAELPYEKAKLSDGNTIIVNVPTYAKYRYSSNRDDRIKVFDAFYTSLKNFKGTYGTLLAGKLKENLFYSKIRNYNSALENSLFANNIPTDVYTNLIDNVNKNLPILHRYLKIRKRMLGIEELHYYDMYPDLVENVNIEFPYEEAVEHIKNALQILGDEYNEKLNEAFENRWIDVFPSMGKASGAYSNSAYGVHPYMKMNYNGKYPDVSMLAHELGHSIHTYFSNKNQPYATANYSSFVAEIAATVNEAFLSRYIISTIEDPKVKLSLLGSLLESSRQTLFRQTQFAEYELIINQKAEAGETLTEAEFTEIYLDLLKKYYGHDEGIIVIEDLYGYEWAYISHFFLGFYNYQYSTSYVAAHALSQRMINEGQEAVDDYIELLSSGGSDYSIPLLKKAGVDMLSEEPFNLTMQSLENIITEMEKILDELE